MLRSDRSPPSPQHGAPRAKSGPLTTPRVPGDTWQLGQEPPSVPPANMSASVEIGLWTPCGGHARAADCPRFLREWGVTDVTWEFAARGRGSRLCHVLDRAWGDGDARAGQRQLCGSEQPG